MKAEFIEIDLSQDFSRLVRGIGLLYSELFGSSAIPSDEQFAHMQAQLTSGNIVCQLFEIHNQNAFAGFFTVTESFACFAGGRYGIINELYIAPDYRSSGLGQQAMQFIANLAAEKQWSRVDVTAPADPQWARTKAFYQQNGFTFTGHKLKLLLN